MDAKKDEPVSIELDSPEGKELLRNITTSYLYPKSKSTWQVTHLATVHQQERDRLYAEKKAGLRLTRRNMCEVFCFVPLRETCEDFLDSITVGNSSFKCLGDSRMGVYASRHCDLIFQKLHNSGRPYPIIMMFKTIITRCKMVPLMNDPNGRSLEPTPNFDCHLPSEHTRSTDLNFEAFQKSLVYLYEYDEELMPRRRPRHCLPVAMLSFNYNGLPIPIVGKQPVQNPYCWKENVISPFTVTKASHPSKVAGNCLSTRANTTNILSTAPQDKCIDGAQTNLTANNPPNIRPPDQTTISTVAVPRVPRITFHQKTKPLLSIDPVVPRNPSLFKDCKLPLAGRDAESVVKSVSNCTTSSAADDRGDKDGKNATRPECEVEHDSTSAPKTVLTVPSSSQSDIEPILNRLQLQSNSVVTDPESSTEPTATRDNQFSALSTSQSNMPTSDKETDSINSSTSQQTKSAVSCPLPEMTSHTMKDDVIVTKHDVSDAKSLDTDCSKDNEVSQDPSKPKLDEEKTSSQDSEGVIGDCNSVSDAADVTLVQSSVDMSEKSGTLSMEDVVSTDTIDGKCSEDVVSSTQSVDCDKNSTVHAADMSSHSNAFDDSVSDVGNASSASNVTVIAAENTDASEETLATQSSKTQCKKSSERFSMSLRKRTRGNMCTDSKNSTSISCTETDPAFGLIQTMSISAEEYEQMNLSSEDASDCHITSTSTLMFDANLPVKEEIYDPFFPTEDVNSSEISSQSCLIVISPEDNVEAPYPADIQIKQEKEDPVRVEVGGFVETSLESPAVLTSSPVTLYPPPVLNPMSGVPHGAAFTPCVYNDIAEDVFRIFSGTIGSDEFVPCTNSMADQCDISDPMITQESCKLQAKTKNRKKKTHVNNIAKFDLEFKGGVLKKMSGIFKQGVGNSNRGRGGAGRGSSGRAGTGRGRGRGQEGMVSRGRGRGRGARGNRKKVQSKCTFYKGICLTACEVKLVDFRKIIAPKKGLAGKVTVAKKLTKKKQVSPLKQVKRGGNIAGNNPRKRKTDVRVDCDSDESDDSVGSVESDEEATPTAQKIRRLNAPPCRAPKICEVKPNNSNKITPSSDNDLPVPAVRSSAENALCTRRAKDHDAGESEKNVVKKEAATEESQSTILPPLEVPKLSCKEVETLKEGKGESAGHSDHDCDDGSTQNEPKSAALSGKKEVSGASPTSDVKKVESSECSTDIGSASNEQGISSATLSSSTSCVSVSSPSKVKSTVSTSHEPASCSGILPPPVCSPAVSSPSKVQSTECTSHQVATSSCPSSSPASNPSVSSPSKADSYGDDVSALVVGLCKHMNKMKDKKKKSVIMAAIRVLLSQEEDDNVGAEKGITATDGRPKNNVQKEPTDACKINDKKSVNSISESHVSSSGDFLDVSRTSRTRRHANHRDPRLASSRDPRLHKHNHPAKNVSPDMSNSKSSAGSGKVNISRIEVSPKYPPAALPPSIETNDGKKPVCQKVSKDAVSCETSTQGATVPTTCTTPLPSVAQVKSISTMSVIQVTSCNTVTVTSCSTVASSSPAVSAPAMPSNLISKLLIKDIAAMQKTNTAKKTVAQQSLSSLSTSSLSELDSVTPMKPACIEPSSVESSGKAERRVPLINEDPFFPQIEETPKSHPTHVLSSVKSSQSSTQPSQFIAPSTVSSRDEHEPAKETTPNEELWADVHHTHPRDGHHVNSSSSNISPNKFEVTQEILSELKARIDVLKHDVELSDKLVSNSPGEKAALSTEQLKECDFNKNCITAPGKDDNVDDIKQEPTVPDESDQIWRNPSPPHACPSRMDTDCGMFDADCFPIPQKDIFSNLLSERTNNVGETTAKTNDAEKKCDSNSLERASGSHLSTSDVTLPLFPQTSAPSLTKLLSGKNATPPPVIAPSTKVNIHNENRQNTDIPLLPKATTSLTHLLTTKMSTSPSKLKGPVYNDPKKDCVSSVKSVESAHDSAFHKHQHVAGTDGQSPCVSTASAAIPDEEEWLYGDSKTPKPTTSSGAEDANLEVLTGHIQKEKRGDNDELDEWIYGDEVSRNQKPIGMGAENLQGRTSGNNQTSGISAAIKISRQSEKSEGISHNIMKKTLVSGVDHIKDIPGIDVQSSSAEQVIPGLSMITDKHPVSGETGLPKYANQKLMGPATLGKSSPQPIIQDPVSVAPQNRGIFNTRESTSACLSNTSKPAGVGKDEAKQTYPAAEIEKIQPPTLSSYTASGRFPQRGHRKELKLKCGSVVEGSSIPSPELEIGPPLVSLPPLTIASTSAGTGTSQHSDAPPLPYYSTPPGSGKTLHQLFSSTMKTSGATPVTHHASAFQKRPSPKSIETIQSPDINSPVDIQSPDQCPTPSAVARPILSSPVPDPVRSPANPGHSKWNLALKSPTSPYDLDLRSPAYSACATPIEACRSPFNITSPAHALKSPISPSPSDHRARRYTSSQFTSPAITIRLSNTRINEREFCRIDQEVCANYQKFLLAHSVWKTLDPEKRENGLNHARQILLDTEEAKLAWALAEQHVRIECRVTYVESHKYVNSLLKFPNDLLLDPSTVPQALHFPLSTYQKSRLHEVKDAVIKLRAENGPTPVDRKQMVKVIVEKLQESKEVLKFVLLPQLPQDSPGNDLELIRAIQKATSSTASQGKVIFLKDKVKALKCQT